MRFGALVALGQQRHSWHQTHVSLLCRLQHTVTLLQQQCEENRVLLQTLRAELHVYESLSAPSAETRTGTGPALCHQP